MTALFHFPVDLLREQKMQWELMGMVVGGGQTGSGVMPLTRMDGGGLWKVMLGDVLVLDADRRRTWRALSRICDGGVQPIIVPMRAGFDAPWPLVGGSELTSLDHVPHSDDAFFSDGTGYASNVIRAESAAAVALRATSMTIALDVGNDLQGGEYFSIDHADLRWRLYHIRTAEDNGDGTWDVTIRPPLRAAIASGTHLEFDRPKSVMRLASADSMDVTFEQKAIARPSVNFIEAFPPFPE